jgi:hypothetical protein
LTASTELATVGWALVVGTGDGGLAKTGQTEHVIGSEFDGMRGTRHREADCGRTNTGE